MGTMHVRVNNDTGQHVVEWQSMSTWEYPTRHVNETCWEYCSRRDVSKFGLSHLTTCLQGITDTRTLTKTDQFIPGRYVVSAFRCPTVRHCEITIIDHGFE